MRSESDDQSLLDQSKSDDDIPQLHKKTKILYTRNYLLSLSKLDTCKRLPSGLDQTILGGNFDSWTALLEPCLSSDPDAGRSHGYLSQCCPNPQDGLLGNAAFQRISGCVPGASPPAFKDNGYHLLSRSKSAYQPPHLFKAKVHSRAESYDLYNNETFGPSEHPRRDRAEEETRRRDSFELMRKEQHKTFQEKQNNEHDEHKENLDPEVATPLEASGNYKRHAKNESEERAASISPSSDSTGHDFTTQTSASRKLLPPAPEGQTLKMNLGTECLAHTYIPEPCDGKREHTKDYIFQPSDFDHQFLPGAQEDTFGMVSRNYSLKPNRFAIPATGNNVIIPPTVDKSGPFEINYKGLLSKGSADQTVVSENEESLSIFDDINKLLGFSLGSVLESKTSPVKGFHENADPMDEICLPEEDSLITVDDFIIPREPRFVANSGSVKADLLTFNSQVDIRDNLEAPNISLSDQISSQFAVDGPIFNSYDVRGLETSYHHLHTKQSLPQFGKCQMNPGRAFFKSAHAQEVQMSFNAKSFDAETSLYNPQPLRGHFPTNALTDYSQNPHIDLMKFAHPINSPLQQQMHVPSKSSSPYQVHGLPRTLPSHHPINELTCYTQEPPHPTQNFPSFYKQQHYRGLDMPIADHIDGGICDKAANRLFEMGDRSTQIHSPSVAGCAVQKSLVNMWTRDFGM